MLCPAPERCKISSMHQMHLFLPEKPAPEGGIQQIKQLFLPFMYWSGVSNADASLPPFGLFFPLLLLNNCMVACSSMQRKAQICIQAPHLKHLLLNHFPTLSVKKQTTKKSQFWTRLDRLTSFCPKLLLQLCSISHRLILIVMISPSAKTIVKQNQNTKPSTFPWKINKPHSWLTQPVY